MKPASLTAGQYFKAARYKQSMGAGGRLAQGKRVVTAEDFIVDDEEVEYETASSDSHSEFAPEESLDEELEQNWVDWAEGEEVDEKLRDVLDTKSMHHITMNTS